MNVKSNQNIQIQKIRIQEIQKQFVIKSLNVWDWNSHNHWKVFG